MKCNAQPSQHDLRLASDLNSMRHDGFFLKNYFFTFVWNIVHVHGTLKCESIKSDTWLFICCICVCVCVFFWVKTNKNTWKCASEILQKELVLVHFWYSFVLVSSVLRLSSFSQKKLVTPFVWNKMTWCKCMVLAQAQNAHLIVIINTPVFILVGVSSALLFFSYHRRRQFHWFRPKREICDECMALFLLLSLTLTLTHTLFLSLSLYFICYRMMNFTCFFFCLIRESIAKASVTALWWLLRLRGRRIRYHWRENNMNSRHMNTKRGKYRERGNV